MKSNTLIAVIILFVSTAYGDFTGTVTRVSDGDTVTVSTASGSRKVRLYGIDAPESKQDYGDTATQALSVLILDKTVLVVERGSDRYGRIIGIIVYNGMDINGTMVRNGHAWRYTQYDRENRYGALEDVAKAERLGLWGSEAPVAPWVYRRNKRG